jgi:hypothetical protein
MLAVNVESGAPHSTGKVDIFQQDRKRFRHESLSKSDGKYDLWVDLREGLSLGNVHDIARSE